MQEDFLHYLWKFKKFRLNNLKSTQGEHILIKSFGDHNVNSGPDFFNAQIIIGDQLWAGNVEIHIKSSDWFLHSHENDKAYDNVILHVVWEDDTQVFRKDNSIIPALELKGLVENEVLYNYKNLFIKQDKWINCESDFANIDDFILYNWLERMYFERLERKANDINQLLQDTKNDWEAVLFRMLMKNFGLNINGESFLSLAHSIDFSIIRKVQSKQHTMEALLFGQAGLLNDDIEGAYFLSLKQEYHFLKQKFNLQNHSVLPLKFFRLRPLNFPTIRLSQIASLYNTQQGLFSKIIETQAIDGFYELFNLATSEYWTNHYTFQKTSKSSKKVLTKSFINLLLVNTILPVKFAYSKQKGETSENIIMDISNAIKSEKNSIVSAFNNLKQVSKTALQSQALIQLKTKYCNNNRCLQCAIGNTILNK
ncbi:DUF2851 family protein [Seonamhaeicola aphaedonensis]|uniref:Uncharacterized protein DUF2851 n=1 Tax=Seonamhaeicola aphaedonensis TaxID=1461338 RepID=A0A3D9HFL2_9FLAO|nr:DUF2851 family protein [Seonamhaeicola aphaedonensis]RED48282.1 uncharacterized protein DUF2851 [Seonamhaeicola aphaedonensis]